MESTFSASGREKSNITAALQAVNLPQSDKALNAKVGWNGIKVNVAAEVKISGFGIVNMMTQEKRSPNTKRGGVLRCGFLNWF
ncbi:hypothetical protein [Rhodovulum sulfidophilum]|uniref:hypothetical protein n=1 Tax=Rhodovulum sulfidophilum TaxID=35806 RepID=UPI001389ED73|nr:hypothetical protein [Rhodovulum sulfidophilum]NDK37001.1 hypothetical protein [Rhodovulum sulfidophilum]